MRKRRLLTAWVTIATFGVLAWSLGGGRRDAIFSPGPLTVSHSADIENLGASGSTGNPADDVSFANLEGAETSSCLRCHDGADGGPATWLSHRLDAGDHKRQSRLCLSCHSDMGEEPFLPHNLSDEAFVSRLGASLPAQVSAGSGRPGLRLAGAMAADRGLMSESLTCSVCHVEHQGREFNLTAMSNDQCQVCHVTQFRGLDEGHPEFSILVGGRRLDYPYRRRTRLNFDHLRHINDYFKQEGRTTPRNCTDCHALDAAKGMAAPRSFEQTCGDCHAEDIGAGDGAFTLLQLPGLDFTTLAENGMKVGPWPEAAIGRKHNAELGPFMRLLLGASSDSPTLDEDLAIAGELRYGLRNLRSASSDQLAAAQRIALAVEALLNDLAVGGELQARLGKALPSRVSADKISRMIGQLPPEMIRMTRDNWFSPRPGSGNIEPSADSQGRQTREVVPDTDLLADDDLLGDQDEPEDLLGAIDADEIDMGEEDLLGESEPPKEDGLLLDDGDLDLLSEDDLLAPETSNNTDAPEASSEEAELPAPATEPYGGWRIDGADFALRYKPTRHADDFMIAWLETTVALDADGSGLEPIFNTLSGFYAQAPGQCTKCHSVDQEQNEQAERLINWRAMRPDVETRAFTKFRHAPHLNLMDQATGCQMCHMLEADSDYSAAFRSDGELRTDPMVFASNFEPISKTLCSSCHNPRLAGDSCLTCHNYHVGAFKNRFSMTSRLRTIGL